MRDTNGCGVIVLLALVALPLAALVEAIPVRTAGTEMAVVVPTSYRPGSTNVGTDLKGNVMVMSSPDEWRVIVRRPTGEVLPVTCRDHALWADLKPGSEVRLTDRTGILGLSHNYRLEGIK